MASFEQESFAGFTADDYNTMMGYEALAALLNGKVTKVTIQGVDWYVFTGDSMALLEALENEGLDLDVTYFSYLKSTWSFGGL